MKETETTNENKRDWANRAAMPIGQILVGDALEQLRRLPSVSVDTVVTSPPYWMLRRYGVEGEIGSEDSVTEWVARLRSVMAEVARVLKPEGAVWLNWVTPTPGTCATGPCPRAWRSVRSDCCSGSSRTAGR